MEKKIRIIIFALFGFFLIQCEKEDIPDLTEIPDINFLNALIEAGIDTNGDSIISSEEAVAVTYLDVSGTYDTLGSIVNMTGIEAFVYLDTLICSFNRVANLDVSNNMRLSLLICNDNQLISLNVTRNDILRELGCNDNRLTTLDVSNNTMLEKLCCFKNELISLNILKNSNLETLICGWNPLSELDCSNLKQLKYLRCIDTPLQSLKIMNCEKLWDLDCFNGPDSGDYYQQFTSLNCTGCYSLYALELSNNKISSLNITDCTNLSFLRLTGNQLEKLNISNNVSLNSLTINDMPTLTEVCVWTMPFPPPSLEVRTTGSPNVFFTTECENK